MSNQPLTPSSNSNSNENSNPSPDLQPQSQPSVDFSPATVPYNEAFENELMNLILHPPDNPPKPTPSSETPMVPASQLPIPLSSNLRTHPSPIPGLNLTHENGYHTGGPGPSPQTIEAYAQKFMEEHNIQDTAELQSAVQEAMARQLEIAKDRMRAREKIVQKNSEIDEQLEKLRLQREAEVRVLEKAKGGKR